MAPVIRQRFNPKTLAISTVYGLVGEILAAGYHGGNQMGDAIFAFGQVRRVRRHTPWPPP
jgi:hypothetical protein